MLIGNSIVNGILDVKECDVVFNRDSIDLTKPGVVLSEDSLILKRIIG